MSNIFPKEFIDLEPYADWSLDQEPARFSKRLGSTMETLQAFYDAGMARARAAMDHLNRFPIDDMPEAERRLYWLLVSLITVSFAVEVWKQPNVPDSGANDFTGVGAPVI